MAPRPKVQMNDDQEQATAQEQSEVYTPQEPDNGPETEMVSDGIGDSDEEVESTTVEELDPDEEIWPGGPTAQDIIDWKEQYGDVYVTSVTYDDHIVWRTLNRAEYKAHVRQMEQLTSSGKLSQADAGMYNEEIIAEMCILYPPYSRQNAASELAGIPSIIAQEVMEASGFVALDVRQL